MGIARIFKLNPIINKNNGQINFTLPKKKLPKELIDMIKVKKQIKFKWEGK